MPPIALDLFEQYGFVHAIVEGDVVKFELTSHVLQGNRVLFFDDILRQVDHLEDTLEADHRRGELHGRAGQSLQSAVELTQIRAKCNDRPNREDVRNDEVTAESIDQRRAHRADEPDDDEEPRADDGATDADIAHVRGPLPEPFLLLRGPPEQLDEQRAADIQRLVHMRVHLGVMIHRFAGDIPQDRA